MGHPSGLRLSLQQVADDLLRPAAEQVDQSRVPRSHVDALIAAGVLAGPREDLELVAGACLSTWFVLTQHFLPMAEVAASDNPALPDLSTGELLSGIALAHLRRPEPPVVCRRVDGGWVFDGHVFWMTGWGICDVFLLGGQAGDQIVFALVPAVSAPGLAASEPLSLLAVQATSTVTLDLSSYIVPDAAVVAVRPVSDWRTQDRDKTADVSPAVFGLQAEVVRRLREPSLAAELAAEAAVLRTAAYALVGNTARYDDRLALRARSLELCLRTATAFVIASGGAGMSRSHPAQRHLREAAFLQVQGQTSELRALMLHRGH